MLLFFLHALLYFVLHFTFLISNTCIISGFHYVYLLNLKWKLRDASFLNVMQIFEQNFLFLILIKFEDRCKVRGGILTWPFSCSIAINSFPPAICSLGGDSIHQNSINFALSRQTEQSFSKDYRKVRV